jgi:hypothetical protein
MNPIWKSLPEDVRLYLAQCAPPSLSRWVQRYARHTRYARSGEAVAWVEEYRKEDGTIAAVAFVPGYDWGDHDEIHFESVKEAMDRADARLSQNGYLLGGPLGTPDPTFTLEVKRAEK